jgi:hypothetical protein
MSPHRGLDGRTPLEQWAQSAEGVHFPEPGLELHELFLFEAKRKVQKDRTVSLNGVVYEVDAALVGETVTLRFDPSAPPQRPLQVCHQGQVTGLARVVETYANCFVKRERPSRTLAVEGPAPEPPASALRLRELASDTDDREER